MTAALMDAAEHPELLDDLWQGKKVGGDYKQTWKALEPDAMLAIKHDDDDEDTGEPDEDILARMGIASSSRPKGGGKTKEEKAKEAEEKKQQKLEKELKQKQEKLDKFQKQVDACTEANDKSSANKQLSKMATILIKEVRFLKVSIAKNPDAGLKESLSDLEQSKEEVEEALVDSDLDVGRRKEVLAKAAKVLKKYKNKDT